MNHLEEAVALASKEKIFEADIEKGKLLALISIAENLEKIANTTLYEGEDEYGTKYYYSA